jgi:hypothetical protein
MRHHASESILELAATLATWDGVEYLTFGDPAMESAPHRSNALSVDIVDSRRDWL